MKQEHIKCMKCFSEVCSRANAILAIFGYVHITKSEYQKIKGATQPNSLKIKRFFEASTLQLDTHRKEFGQAKVCTDILRDRYNASETVGKWLLSLANCL